MDKYTQAVQKVNDLHYSRTYPDGKYIPSEPIYGFRTDPPRGYILNYIRHYRLLQALSRFKIESALDIGGGEGYSAALVKQILKVPRVDLSDLSREACKRATEIYGLKAYPSTIHNLPFRDNAYDVVFSSETLEHVTDFERAVGEMVRVAKVAIVFTVPHESQAVIAKSITQGHVGDHINSLSREFLMAKLSQFGKVSCEKMISPLLIPASVLVDASPRAYDQFHERSGYPRLLIELYNRLTPLFARLTGEQQAAWVVELDEYASRHLPWHKGILCMILRKPGKMGQPQYVSARDVVEFKVPSHYINK